MPGPHNHGKFLTSLAVGDGLPLHGRGYRGCSAVALASKIDRAWPGPTGVGRCPGRFSQDSPGGLLALAMPGPGFL